MGKLGRLKNRRNLGSEILNKGKALKLLERVLDMLELEQQQEASEAFEKVWARLPLDLEVHQTALMLAAQLDNQPAIYHLATSLETLHTRNPAALYALALGWGSLECIAISHRYFNLSSAAFTDAEFREQADLMRQQYEEYCTSSGAKNCISLENQPRALELYERAECAYNFESKSTDKVVELCSQILKLGSNFSVALVLRATALMAQDHHDQAQADILQVLSNEPQNIMALRLQIEASLKLGRLHELPQTAQALKASEPRAANELLRKIEGLYLLGQIEDITKSYDSSADAKLYEDLPDSQRMLYLSLCSAAFDLTNQSARAQETLERALLLDLKPELNELVQYNLDDLKADPRLRLGMSVIPSSEILSANFREDLDNKFAFDLDYDWSDMPAGMQHSPEIIEQLRVNILSLSQTYSYLPDLARLCLKIGDPQLLPLALLTLCCLDKTSELRDFAAGKYGLFAWRRRAAQLLVDCGVLSHGEKFKFWNGQDYEELPVWAFQVDFEANNSVVSIKSPALQQAKEAFQEKDFARSEQLLQPLLSRRKHSAVQFKILTEIMYDLEQAKGSKDSALDWMELLQECEINTFDIDLETAGNQR